MSNLVVSPITPTTPIQRDGVTAYEWIKFFQNIAEAVNNALTLLGEFNGSIGASATVAGRSGTLANAVQHLSPVGVIQPGGIDFNTTAPAFSQVTGTASAAQLAAATSSNQGAVLLPPGALSNALGSASLHAAADFDAAGSAAAAQAAAEAYASNASNLSSGTVSAGLLPASVPLVSFGTGAPGGTPTESYIYFDTTGTPYHGYVAHSGAWHQFS